MARGITKYKRSNAQDKELKEKMLKVLQDETRSYHECLQYVQNEIQESTRTVQFNYKLKCFLEDGAFALHRAVEEVNGFTSQKKDENPSGENPPQMLDVRFADGSRIKVPFGTIDLPNFGSDAYIEMAYQASDMILFLQGQCEKRFVSLMDEIVEETRRILDRDSIYRGQAIKILGPGNSPQFIDLSEVRKSPMFLTGDVKFATVPIEARIENTQECVDNKIDLKFGVLLEGTYGSGKTLYAFNLAVKAIDNGWTFIYCPRPEEARYVMQVANMLNKNGKGAVLFIEDIDKVLHERTNETNEISLLMDGGETKANNVITILTTNHMDKINPTFLRGKRIGSIVSLSHLDAKAAREMIEYTLVDEKGHSLLIDDCGEAAQAIQEHEIVPAFVSEILDRVKSYRIYSRKEKVSCEDILNSIKSYRRQMEIATVKKPGKESKAELLVKALQDIFPNEDHAGKVIKFMEEKGF